MEVREMIESLVPQLTRNAVVVDIQEREERYSVTIAGTASVTARCELPRATAEDATEGRAARQRVEWILKCCADQTVASLGDGRF
jgi:hypothetical protein